MRVQWNHLWMFAAAVIILMSGASSGNTKTKLIITSLEDTKGSEDVMTLRRAINKANATFDGSNFIDIEFGNLSGEILLHSDLPPVSSFINIYGNPYITINGDNKYRVFTLLNGHFYLSTLTITNAFAKGGNGGEGKYTGGGGGAGMGAAFFVFAGEAFCYKVAFINNKAQGGKGGAADSTQKGYAGSGGGFAGDGYSMASMLVSAAGGSGGVLDKNGQGGMAGGATYSGDDGGFGGGGGGASWNQGLSKMSGGDGGFGGGGGGGYSNNTAGSGKHFGGDGSSNGSGGGGAGLGGAIFVRENAYMELRFCTFTGNSALHGHGRNSGSDGKGKGGAIFVMNGARVRVQDYITVNSNTADDTENPDILFDSSMLGAIAGYRRRLWNYLRYQ